MKLCKNSATPKYIFCKIFILNGDKKIQSQKQVLKSGNGKWCKKLYQLCAYETRSWAVNSVNPLYIKRAHWAYTIRKSFRWSEDFQVEEIWGRIFSIFCTKKSDGISEWCVRADAKRVWKNRLDLVRPIEWSANMPESVGSFLRPFCHVIEVSWSRLYGTKSLRGSFWSIHHISYVRNDPDLVTYRIYPKKTRAL